jgi:hypothetical protein
LILLCVYHLVDTVGNFFEIFLLKQKHTLKISRDLEINCLDYYNTMNLFFSLNSLYGFILFIYVQILYFYDLSTGTCLFDTSNPRLLYDWLLIEIYGFYLSCIFSIIIFIILLKNV